MNVRGTAEERVGTPPARSLQPDVARIVVLQRARVNVLEHAARPAARLTREARTPPGSALFRACCRASPAGAGPSRGRPATWAWEARARGRARSRTRTS